MPKVKEAKPTDVGVIVGRFQVSELHDGHKSLIDFVFSRHEKVIIFLGLTPVKSSYNDPLDFESRKKMVLDEYPEANVLYIKDQLENEVWSGKLDEQIGDVVSPTQTVTLYGSRDSFMSCYTGRYPTKELEQEVFISGTDERKRISNQVKGTPEFRAGAIWAMSNQWPKAIPTVDVAIFNDDYTKLLLAQKPNESQWRFVGGFVEPGGNWEQTARREVAEETHLEVDDITYVGSAHIADWRYRAQVDQITTTLFTAKKVFGRPTPDDDISALRWFPIVDGKADLEGEGIVENHKELLKMLEAKLSQALER